MVIENITFLAGRGAAEHTLRQTWMMSIRAHPLSYGD